jgi:hypothetical protein
VVRVLVVLLLCGCQSHDLISTGLSLREIGLIPNPPGASGRDVGCSIAFGGHSVWLFGDTFFANASADGYHWRASTWSYTDDNDASDGLDNWTHGLGSDGEPAQLLPHTAAEQAFDDAHNGNPCTAGSDCGARETAWVGSATVDPTTGTAWVFYQKENTDSNSYSSNGFSIATWASPGAPATRPALRPELPDPTVMFPDGEPQLDAAAVVDGGFVYAYACPGGGLSSPCTVARAPVDQALVHAAWTFFDGTSWSSDPKGSAMVMEGAPYMSVHFSPYLGKFVAFHMGPLDGHLRLSTADHPEGPWSGDTDFGQGASPPNNFDYGLVAHPELARDGGRVEYLSYYQPGTFLNGVIHLVEITYP